MQNPGRPREFDPDDVLSKIMHLFWENGYEATGLSDIIAVTGLGKASLYKTFGNKQAIYLRALSHYEQLNVDGAVTALRAGDSVPMDRIDAFLSAPILAVQQNKDRRGCFLCNASSDRASLDEETGALVRRGYEKMRKALRAALSDALPDTAPDTIDRRAEVVLTVYSGLRVMARSAQTTDTMQMTKDEVIRALKQG